VNGGVRDGPGADTSALGGLIHQAGDFPEHLLECTVASGPDAGKFGELRRIDQRPVK
jgi:hypothetical protein